MYTHMGVIDQRYPRRYHVAARHSDRRSVDRYPGGGCYRYAFILIYLDEHFRRLIEKTADIKTV